MRHLFTNSMFLVSSLLQQYVFLLFVYICVLYHYLSLITDSARFCPYLSPGTSSVFVLCGTIGTIVLVIDVCTNDTMKTMNKPLILC